MKFLLAVVTMPLAALTMRLGGITPMHSRDSHHHPAPVKIMERQASVSIDTLFKNKGKLYFGAAGDNDIMQQGKTETILQQNFGQVTPEYSMKWDATEPTPGTFTFGNADFLVDWAQANNKSIHGHTLLWHTALPTWVSDIRDKDELTRAIQLHIKAVVGRYRGKIRSWVGIASCRRHKSDCYEV